MIESRLLNSTDKPVAFMLANSIDHMTGATGKTPTLTIRKSGGAFGAPAGAVTEVGSGWYELAGNATDRNTLGECLFHIPAGTGYDPKDFKIDIVGYDPFDTYWGIPGFNKLQNYTSGTATFVNPLDPVTMILKLTAGQAYKAADGLALLFPIASGSYALGSTVTFTDLAQGGGEYTKTGIIVAGPYAQIELTSSESPQLQTGFYSVTGTLQGSNDTGVIAVGQIYVSRIR